MNYKPYVAEEIKKVYLCPLCSTKNQYESTIEDHIIWKHEWPELVKATDHWGSSCTFKTEDQARTFRRLNQARWNKDHSIFSDHYTIKLNWDGPGKYRISDPKKISENYQGNKFYEMTISKWTSVWD